uniref:Myosin binding protein C, fast type n=1 Tax=Equus asinus asinus TaxID=83772 RepID=A0A8C4LLC7_EQUAS
PCREGRQRPGSPPGPSRPPGPPPRGAPAPPPRLVPAAPAPGTAAASGPESKDSCPAPPSRPTPPTSHPGKDTVIVAKVNGKELQGKPTFKWIKGKWLELGSKSGARFTFKESHDPASNVRTLWGRGGMGARAGGCTGPASQKAYCLRRDSAASEKESDTAGGWRRQRETLTSSPRGGPACSPTLREVVEEENKKKKKDDDDLGIPPEVWELLKGAKKSEYERIAFQYGITDLRGMLKRLKKAKVEVKKSAAFTKKLDPAYQVDKGNKIKLVVEISDPDLPLKWFKNGQEIKPSSKYVFENVGKKRILTINKCTLADDAAYEVVVKDEKCFTELFVREPPVLIITPLEDQQVFVGDRVEMSVEVSEEGAQVMWMKDGVEMTREDSYKAQYRFKKDGKRHILIYSEVTLEDKGRYRVMTNGGQCEADLIVEEKQLEVLQDIADLTVKASEQAEFKCEVSDEKVTGKWYKNGVEVRPSKRITISHIGRVHKLPLEGIGRAQLPSLKLPRISALPPEPPKIHLDCSGKTSENAIVVVAGNKLRLDVSITGEPPPVATWLKEDQVWWDMPYALTFPSQLFWVFSATEGRVRIEQREGSSSFLIESAERGDEGRYTIKVTNPAGEDVASIFLRVVDVPDPPEAVRVTSVGEDWAVLVWEPPKYDGGQPLTGYLLERKKKGSQRWMKLNFEVFTELTYESTNMIEGVLYEMRVFAVNAIGVSQPSVNTKPFMPIAPTSEPQHLMVEDVTDTTTTLKWRPPDKIGAGGIDGYLVEYCVEGSDEWIPANTEPVERCGFTVKNLPTGAKIVFRVVGVNIAGRSQPATLTQPVTIREIQPKIRLPRHLRETYVRKVGEHLNLVIPFQGKPRPQVVWTKGGAPVDASRVHVRTSDFDTVFFVREAARSDSGEYELGVQIENMKDTATIRIRVVEKAGPPEHVMVKEVWGTNALVEWQPPKDDGNSEITGYLVQKADKKTMEWFTVYEHNRHTCCTVSDLIMGNEYYFRVYSENFCGLSDLPGVSKNTARIVKTGITFKPFEYKEHDFRMAPKFLTPLPDRVVVAGYAAALNCAVRGHPKPKVVWMKNNMEIREDPKFLMTNYQGVLTLNIRRPSPFDAGTYSCRAVNELGEALAECKLEATNYVPQRWVTLIGASQVPPGL